MIRCLELNLHPVWEVCECVICNILCIRSQRSERIFFDAGYHWVMHSADKKDTAYSLRLLEHLFLPSFLKSLSLL